MELNKNKIIFGIIAGIILIFFIFFVVNLNNAGNKKTTNSGVGNSLKIWLVGDDSSKSLQIVEDFKLKNPGYKTKNIIVESFSNYEDYTYALVSAMSSGNMPDIFVQNNNEKKSIFSEQVLGIDPEIINPNDFRKKYKSIFSNDLIASVEVDGKQKEFLIGIPVGYETLGIYYNMRQVRSSDLKNMSTFNNGVLPKLKKKYPNLVPIAIGNGSTVDYASDIVTQFFMLEGGIKSLNDIANKDIKQALGTYLMFGESDGDNGYNSRFLELKNLGEKGLYLFTRGDSFMLVGYPRMINEIDAKGFSKTYLQAAPFPHYFSSEGNTLASYNYFVINKNSVNVDFATTFLSYLSTDSGASKFLDTYTYYLPALSSLESEKLEEKIHPNYNVVLKDFYNNEYELSSFDKGIKNVYDKNIESVLDNSSTYLSTFTKFKTSILCKTNKVVNFSNLSVNCD